MFYLTRDKVNYKIIEIKPLKKSREATKEDTVKMAVSANFRVTLPQARFSIARNKANLELLMIS